ncbi:DUF7535 family protein [Halobacterium yunchengense]|uniref:DUF7535 family protein n=1 Tax=Halobacterium yunchengense TaxID=3108497 RepID=UPI00300B96C2
MSESDEPPYRSVSRLSREYRNAEMSSIGWTIFLGLVVVMLPLLPFLVAVWAVGKFLDYTRARS